MEKDLIKSEWIIDVKGYFPEMIRETWSGEYFSDLVYSTRTINFTGTKEELDEYLDKLTSKESQLKIIGILNKADTLVEFRRIFDVPNIPTSKVTISDVFNGKTWILPVDIAKKLLPKDESERLFDILKDNPTRRYIRRDTLEEFIIENLKNLE